MRMKIACTVSAISLAASCGLALAAAEDGKVYDGAQRQVIVDGRIAYVMTHRAWAVHQTPEGKVECPVGYNDGPREQFKQLFPNDGSKRTLVDTQIMREARQWFPDTSEEGFKFKDAGGKISYGLDLDGQVGAEDFISPDGVKGVDNQLYRAIGCISNYRAPEGTIYHFEQEYMRRYNYNRMLIELTGVDNLVNDPEVTVTSYRGRDELLTSATGESFISGGTQRPDLRFGKPFISQWKGKIVDGVLITEPADYYFPSGQAFDTNDYHYIRGARYQLKLTENGAEGVIAGYVDVEWFNHHLNTSWSTHHQSYGQLSAPSLYRALNRLADGYPDPKTGQMRGISGALNVKYTQVFVNHPPRQTADARGRSMQVTTPAQ
ncbi:MAG: hypothetical protein AB7E79_06855 [Rhodospirillaceae bacterium]